MSVAPPPKPGQAGPRWWRLRHDREKCFAIRQGTSHPALGGRIRGWIWDFELPAIAVYRLGQLALVLKDRSRVLALPPFAFYVVLQYLLRLVLHVEVAHRCRIGPGFHLGHPYGILIGPTDIGPNCSVTHGVTIGMGLSTAGERGIPVLGRCVWIGPNAILTGGITIGDGATIAAGSVVSRDIPARALVAGNPARVVSPNYDNSKLLGYAMQGEEVGLGGVDEGVRPG